MIPVKRYLLLLSICYANVNVSATVKDSTWQYSLPDSVKAVNFMADFTPGKMNNKGFFQAGIKTDAVQLYYLGYKKKKEIHFSYPYSASVVSRGESVFTSLKDGSLHFNFSWEEGKTYKLLIATVSDSAENFSLYSGYIWLPAEEKWKLIGTCKITGRWNTLLQPAGFIRKSTKNTGEVITGQAWCQRNNGSWKQLAGTDNKPPVINLASHTDSLAQWHQEISTIEEAIKNGTTDVKENKEGVYYTMMKEGTGKAVTVNDTVTVFYKGYLFSDGKVFDQTKEKPATFPLKRLIRGWQIGIPLCKVGGKIKLVIPSSLAYSIRTRAAKIPPNSILVFEIEVVDTKPPQ